MIPSKQHTILYSWKNLKLLLFFVLCNLAFCKSYAQYYSFKTNDFYKNSNPKKNKVYTSWANINGRRWDIKTDAVIRDFDEYTYCLKVGTSSSGASYLELKPDISKSKIRKIVISLQTSTDDKLRKLLNTVMAVDDKRIAPVEKGYINDSIISFTFANIVINDIPKIEIFYDKNKTYFIAVQSIEVTNEIDKNEDNSTTITSNKGIENNIIQVTRTLSKDYWNTFCLPFNVDKDSVKLYLNDPELREFTGKVDGTTMLFKDATEMKAGIPYIIKPKKDVVNPIFRNVTITEVEPKTITDETGNYAFVGAYSPTELKQTGQNFFLATKIISINRLRTIKR